MVDGSARGDVEQRELFARRYLPVVRAYLAARWHLNPLRERLDDAVQEVFVDCFRADGALQRVEHGEPGSFRRFLRGVVRNVARRFEEGRGQGREVALQSGAEEVGTEEHLSRVFDRAWIRSLLRQAAELQRIRAQEGGEAARRRVELLRLRFAEDLPIREIAARWSDDPARLHHEYAHARQEFKAALRDVLEREHGADPPAVERACRQLLEHFQ